MNSKCKVDITHTQTLQAKEHFDLTNSESPEFIGMVISKLTLAPNIINKTGKVLITAREAIEYGIKDIDGTQPKPHSLNETQIIKNYCA